jgi:DNA-binding NtrC family response regulator
LLEHIWRDPDLRSIPVVILSSMSRNEIERRFADRGVYDFVDKSELTRERLQQVIRDHGLVESESMIGHSVAFLNCLREARQRAKLGTDNILLLGETGTGKELLAKYIHDNSPRSHRAYVTVYTQGVPETLVDDRLFGHEPGAYTGAKGSAPGAAEEAHQGTLFIDEFGDLPATIQSKLLRLLDKNTRESQRMGARPDQIRKLDLQVVLATNKVNILTSDDFRKDLLHRVRTSDAIQVPALRDRREDIPLLAEHFVRKCEEAFKSTLKPEHRTISPEAMQAFCGTDWPGNVRDLEHAIESAVYRFPKLRVLSVQHLRLPDRPQTSPRSEPAVVHYPRSLPASSGSLQDILDALDHLAFSDASVSRSAWAGRLPDIHAALTRISAILLTEAIEATRKATPANPDGDILYTPAVKLALGVRKLSTPQAADVVIAVVHQAASAVLRRTGRDEALQAELLSNPALREAYFAACRDRKRPPAQVQQEKP